MKDQSKKIRTVTIQSLHSKGAGTGTTDTGGTLRVPYTIPGETVTVEKKRRDGRLLEILEPSPHRIDPKCKHFEICGGCAWQHIDYAHQLELKTNPIVKQLKTLDVNTENISISIEPSQPYHYRNRMDFVWWYDGSFGLRQRGKWYSVVNLEECHLLPPKVMQTALEVHRRALELGLPFRDQKKKIPGLRYLVIRSGIFTEEIMLNIVSDSMPLPSALWEELDNVVSVYQLVNDKPESDTSDGIPVHLYGAETYVEELLGKRFHIAPNTFFQPNPAMAEKMALTIQTWIKEESIPAGKLVDLYCGCGMFSILLSDDFENVTGIELIEDSIALAKKNSNKPNVNFIHADAVTIDEKWLNKTDVLLVDPPREGLLPKVMQKIKNQKPSHIIYVSCNPKRAVQDIAELLALYDVKKIAFFDQFPQTPHVEMISLLNLSRV